MVDINELMLSEDANFKEYATFFMKLRGDCKSKEEEEQYIESLYSLSVKNAQEAFE